MEGPWIWLLVGANLVFVGLGSLLVWTWLFRDREGNADPTGAWYAETRRLAGEIHRLSQTDPTTSIDRKILPLSFKLKRHAASAPAGVDARSQRQAYRLGVRCERLIMDSTARSDVPPGLLPEDSLAEVRELATVLQERARPRSRSEP